MKITFVIIIEVNNTNKNHNAPFLSNELAVSKLLDILKYFTLITNSDC